MLPICTIQYDNYHSRYLRHYLHQDGTLCIVTTRQEKADFNSHTQGFRVYTITDDGFQKKDFFFSEKEMDAYRIGLSNKFRGQKDYFKLSSHFTTDSDHLHFVLHRKYAYSQANNKVYNANEPFVVVTIDKTGEVVSHTQVPRFYMHSFIMEPIIKKHNGNLYAIYVDYTKNLGNSLDDIEAYFPSGKDMILKNKNLGASIVLAKINSQGEVTRKEVYSDFSYINVTVSPGDSRHLSEDKISFLVEDGGYNGYPKDVFVITLDIK